MAARCLTEVCIDSVAGAEAAEQGGADRVELCANLLQGGTTPSSGMIRSVGRATSLPVMVLIRPRPGHFCFDSVELATMRSEAAAVLDEGAAGIVIGSLRGDGLIDQTICGQLREMARDRQVTFHRAFDQVAEPLAAIETLISLGIDRVLTSGQAASAWEGRERLRQFVQAARDRIVIMPGGGVRADNVQQILHYSGAREIHFSGSQLVDDPVAVWRQSVPMSAPEVPGDLQRRVTSLQQVRAIVEAAHG